MSRPERLAVDENANTALFTGDVVVIQDTMTLYAPWVKVFYKEDQSGISHLKAKDGVTLLQNEEAAESETADYDLEKEIIVMNGDVLVTQKLSAIASDKMTVRLDDGTALMTGRVKSLLRTNTNSEKGRRMKRADLQVTEGSSGLRIVNLRKSYKKKVVIRDVSMTLDRGEVVALLGPNGSGKTTSFYTIAGLVYPEGGSVTIDGRVVTNLPMYRRAKLGIGYLPQEMSIFRGMNVRDNIASILDISVKDRQKRRERLEELLSEFSIEHLRSAPALALSGGERRRVEIARCLAADPKYLLLDEPFAGVDPISVGDIRHLVADLKKRGIGVLITDHNVRETLEIVDRAYILHDGQVLMSGTPEEVVENENVRRVYLGDNFKIS